MAPLDVRTCLGTREPKKTHMILNQPIPIVVVILRFTDLDPLQLLLHRHVESSRALESPLAPHSRPVEAPKKRGRTHAFS